MYNLLLDTDLIILNNRDLTFHHSNCRYSDILDYAVVTSKLYNYIDSFKILDDVGSDHLPIFIKFKCNIDKNNTIEITDQNLNYNKANWALFKFFLIKSASEIDTKISLNEFNKTVCEKILLFGYSQIQ